MKIAPRVTLRDGFNSNFCIVFENGLILKTESVLWSGSENAKITRQKFNEVVDALIKAGFELSNQTEEETNGQA